MNDSPMLSKMDALLKKHRGSGEGDRDAVPERAASPSPAAPPDAWLPVLTQVIERGTPPLAGAPAAPPVVAPRPQAETPAAVAPAADLPVSGTPVPTASDALAEQLMSELAPRLSEVMEKQVAAELRKNLDQTVAALLSQLDGDVREIARDAIAEKLRQPRDPST